MNLSSKFFFIQNVSSLLIANLFSAGVFYSLYIYFTHIINVDDYGYLNLFLSFGLISFQISELGINIQAQRLSSKPKARYFFLNNAIRLRLFFIIITLILIFLFFIFFLQYNNFNLLISFSLLMLSAAFESFSSTLISGFNGLGKIKVTAFSIFLRSISFLLLCLLFTINFGNLILISLAYFICSFLKFLYLFIKYFKNYNIQLKKNSFLKLLRVSWKYGLIGFLSLLIARVEIFIINDLLGVYYAGLYSVPLMVCTLVNVISYSFVQSIWSVLVRNKTNSTNFKDLYIFYLKITLILMVFFMFFGWFLAPYFITTFFNVNYLSTIQTVKIMILSASLIFPLALAGSAINALHMPNFIICYTILVSLVKITSSFYLIDSFGMNGGPFANLITFLLGLIILHFSVLKNCKIHK